MSEWISGSTLERVARRVQTPPSARGLEDREAAVALVDDDTRRNRECGVAVGVRVAPGEQAAAAADDPQRRPAVGAGPLTVEALANRVVERFTGAVETEIECLAGLRADFRQAAGVAGLVEDRRARGERIADVGVEPADVAASAHERFVGLGMGSDRDARLGDRVFGPARRLVRDDAEHLLARAGDEAEAPLVGLDGERVGTGQPRDGLVAVRIVDQHRAVGLDHDRDAAALRAGAGSLEGRRTVAGEDANRLGHTTGVAPSSVIKCLTKVFARGRFGLCMDVPDAAVLFDMDGVLVDSETYWHRFEDEWVFAEAIESGDPAHEEVTGTPYYEIYDYLEETYGTAVSKDTFTAKYEERAESLYGEQVVLTDGVPTLFDAIRDDGRKLAIVSSALRAWIDIVRERFSLDPLDLVVSAEEIDGPGKPAPDIYEHAVAELGLDPAECVVVEDSVNGIESAVRAGAFTVGFRSTHNAELDLSRADVVVDGGMAEVRDLLFG